MLDKIEDAIKAIADGEVIIVVDDEDRENEGDFICAADAVTPEMINFMASEGRGLICTPILPERAEALHLSRMVNSNTALHETAFTVSIDYNLKGCTTGISAYDRATGIKAMTEAGTMPEDFARPGHIFPLIAKNGGVLVRSGHTEAAVDLARLAGRYPAGVLVEILKEDGSMARLPDLMQVAKKFDLRIISIEDLIEYRLNRERLVKESHRDMIPSPFGELDVRVFKENGNDSVHVLVGIGDYQKVDVCPVRVHSSQRQSDMLDLIFSKEGNHIANIMSYFQNKGAGVLLLLNHGAKSEYNIVTQLNSFKGIKNLNSRPDKRRKDYGIGSQILLESGISKLAVITSNPDKEINVSHYGLETVNTIDLNNLQ